ncbi:hypothetical protein [Streptomyces sp. NPDC047070]|uniref:hypothetical protein n=1 Tax=Streptomyces sp. NPDC047070 TaxID=3154923 RepID=UPI0034573714
MATTMQNYGLRWIDSEGSPHVSVAAYDWKSADHRRGALRAAKCDPVEIVETRPGQRLEPLGGSE